MQTEIVKALMGAAGAVGGATYVDDVFSTQVYTGTGSARSINNGVNLSGKGGLVWSKIRSNSYSHAFVDTERGATKVLRSEHDYQETTDTNTLTAFSTTGYSLGADTSGWVNYGTGTNEYVSWTFRKAEGFFDVVTYSGTGSAKTVAHNLGSVPSCIIIKRVTGGGADWAVYHASRGATKYLKLNTTDSEGTSSDYFNNTAPTASVFSVGGSDETNEGSSTYVAYLFAHDEQSFGEDENASVIKCGSYTGNGSSTGPTINLGWEPQWLLIKNATGTTNWRIVDNMRGIVTTGNEAFLTPDLTEAEWDSNKIDLTPTGFKITAHYGDVNENNDTIIYVAIRRPDGYVGKPPDAGTDVFTMAAGGSSAAGGSGCFNSGFPVDFGTIRTTGSHPWQTGARLIGTKYLPGINLTNAQADASNFTWDSNTGYMTGNFGGYQSWMWKRHAGFDVVAYEGNGTAGRQFSHSLNQIPEMIWFKNRTQTSPTSYHWIVYHKGMNGGTNPEQYYSFLDTNDEEGSSNTFLNATAPTATTITVGTNAYVNTNSEQYLAMLFASVDGISKVGYYTGNGSATSQTITLGFQPRFLIVKNVTTNTHGWGVLDTTRGWASGNDQILNLDSSSAQTAADIGAPVSTGFTLTTSDADWNENNSTFIYYAHA